MAKFIFKMQNILAVKYKLEDQAKSRYGMAMAKLRREEEIQRQLCQKKAGYELQLGEKVADTSAGLNIMEIRQLEDAVETMKYKISIQKIEVNRAEHQVNMARMQLDEAMKERKTYEKLKEKAFEEFKKEIESEERKEIDELVSFKFGSKGANTDDTDGLAM